MDYAFIALEFGLLEMVGSTGYDVLKVVVLFACAAFVWVLE